MYIVMIQRRWLRGFQVTQDQSGQQENVFSIIPHSMTESMGSAPEKPRVFRFVAALLGLVVLSVIGLTACGGDQGTPTMSPVATPALSAVGQTNPTPTTAVMPQPTANPPSVTGTSGTINYGVVATGSFKGHPRFIVSPGHQYVHLTVGESLITVAKDLTPKSTLATEWSISEDSRVWTWQIRNDVEFHKGYGELTVEDLLYSFKQYSEGGLHARSGIIGNFWAGNKGGWQKIIDDFTVSVDTGEPILPAQAFEFMMGLGASSTSIASKKQSDDLGAEEANTDIAMTGPWEIDEHRDDQFWRLTAVQNHWRQTPFFDELVLWSIPEESARVAGFQTGLLDTFQMAFDSIPSVESVEGAVLVGWPNAGQAGLNIHGQTYGTDRNGNPYAHLDCKNAWVSCDEDTDSVEWANAVKVKRAMALAIDRRAIVDTLLSWFGDVLYIRDWMGHDAKSDPRWVFPYDPESAKELLVDAGYPDGFTITLTPALRGAPAEVETCEAVGQYWEQIGIDVKIQNIPIATLLPSMVTREYQGATCLSVGPRLTPIIGAANYVKQSQFSYGTEHPWLEDHVTDALLEVNQEELVRKEREVYDWIFDNVMAFALFSTDGSGRSVPNWIPIGLRGDSVRL